MTAFAEVAITDGPGTRPRPRVHYTADDGWINDPYGITWTGDRYRLFYQAIPGRVTWAPQATWGQAESPDLVRWRPLEPALTPQQFELGCWSGCAVPEGAGLRLFYTRVTEPDWGRGAIAVARPAGPDGSTWATRADDVAVAGPPAELGVRAFRDPFIFRHGDEWVMIVGAALLDGAGAAIQFRSPDLESWTCDGLLASRLSKPDDACWTGNMWECPQFFQLGDDWVLLVSVWHEDVLHHVAAGIGDYDGRRFTPRTWQQLTFGPSAYAMTSFTDRAGRRCVMSWLREEPQNDPSLIGRASAHSVAALLTAAGDGRLELRPHPDLAALAEPVAYPAGSTGPTRMPVGGRAVDLTLIAQPGLRVELVDGQHILAALTYDGASGGLHIARARHADGVMPASSGHELRLLIDADVLEVFGAGGYGAFRIGIPADQDASEIVINPPHPEFSLRVF